MDLKTALIITYYRAYFKILGELSPEKAGIKALDRFSRPRFRKVRSKSLHVFQKAQLTFENIDGQNIAHYYWKGEGEKSLLLAHGWESDSGTFEGLIEYFLKKGWSIRAVDAPAHGQSEGTYIRLPIYAAILKQMVSKYSDIEFCIGHSFGAMALAYANDQQKSVDNFPPHALVASAIELSESMAPFIRIVQLSEKVVKAFYQAIEDLGNKPVSWYSLPRMLSSGQTPVLLLHDKYDKICPIKDLQPIIDKKPTNVTIHLTNGLGHSRIIKDEKTWSRINDFIEGTLKDHL